MSTELVDPMASVRAYVEAEKSSNTRRAYASDWTDFSAWCGRISAQLPASPVDVARYLAQLADGGLKTSTIQRRTSAIAAAHKVAGLEPPTNFEGVKAVMRGIRRRLTKRKAAPAPAELLAEANERIPATKRGLRDRAVVLVGFAGAFRRSELVDIKVNDIERRQRGIIVHLGKSKTDQEGEGAALPIPAGGRLKTVEARRYHRGSGFPERRSTWQCRSPGWSKLFFARLDWRRVLSEGSRFAPASSPARSTVRSIRCRS